MRNPPSTGDRAVDAALRDLVAAARELQDRPRMLTVAGVQLPDGVAVAVPHGLGRDPLWVRESSPRGAVSIGCVEEVLGGSVPRSTSVVLRATGWGATITVDLAVFG